MNPTNKRMKRSSIEQIKDLESLFSDNKYDGSGEKAFVIEEGSIPIMVSAPHAINQYREGQIKWADMYTGGIARYLHEVTDCHLIYSCMFTETDPNYDCPGTNRYQESLEEYVKTHGVKFLLDLHGASRDREYAIEMGTAPNQNRKEDPSLHQLIFADRLIQYIFEDCFKDLKISQKKVWKNVIFDAGDQNTVTKYISENTETACVQIEINRELRTPDNEEAFCALLEGLTRIIKAFSIVLAGE